MTPHRAQRTRRYLLGSSSRRAPRRSPARTGPRC